MPLCGLEGCLEALAWRCVTQRHTVEIPPGPRRDTEVAKALGWTPAAAPSVASWVVAKGMVLTHWSPSTDEAACERLIEELANRGWSIRDVPGAVPSVECIGRSSELVRRICCEGSTRCDAVSAAALLALRHGS